MSACRGRGCCRWHAAGRLSWGACAWGYFWYFCPGLQALETTLDSDKTRADISLAVLYVMFTIMAIPAPRIVQLLGPKYVRVPRLQSMFHCSVVLPFSSVARTGVELTCACTATSTVSRVSMLVGATPYILICVSNISPSYYTTTPAFGLVGIGAAILWTGQGVRAVCLLSRVHYR